MGSRFAGPAALPAARARQVAWAAALAAAATGALAQPIEFTGSVGVSQRRLQERSAGATLLTEQGPVGVLQLEGTRNYADGKALSVRFTALGGDLDYDGQTQAGAPLSTRSRHSEAGLDLLVRPHAPAPWGEAWLTLGWLGNRRDIRSTPAATGLLEDSSSVWAGLRWRAPQLPAAGWQLRPEVEGRISVWHRIDVDFRGAREPLALRPLDDASFEGARRRQLVLRLVGSRPESPWSWALEWSRITQGESPSAPLTANGAPVGTVRQPELSIEDFGLRVSRRF
ncbi:MULTISPECIES: hypothetical protein [Ramlibacter]|uniref:Uncharacterized protein n=1 Tax=Ramlibacter pinisoli TaxID=2682844 RepID=A0A6N8J2F4_9BURK|nr:MULTISPECIES: hypothetical protein [Ramlibacter]MBA2963051.1 hypothetical protein [Ramlibacter sp. CGMCC 1.13660]MVQ32995.1 hypothetical protein [Ramlibacter pinisoli]